MHPFYLKFKYFFALLKVIVILTENMSKRFKMFKLYSVNSREGYKVL